MEEDQIVSYIINPMKFFFKNLPAGTCIHFQNVYKPQKIDLTIDGQDYLDQSVISMHEQAYETKHRCFLFISFPQKYHISDFVIYGDEGFKRIDKRKLTTNVNYPEVNDKIKIVNQFATILNETVQVKAVLMDETALLSYMQAYVSLHFFEQPHFGNIQDRGTCLQIGGKYLSFLSMHKNPDADLLEIDYPNFTTDFTTPVQKQLSLPASFVTPITLGLNCEHITNLSFLIHDKAMFGNKLKKHNRDLNSLGARFDNNREKYHFVNGFIESVENDPQEYFVTYALNVMVMANSENGLVKASELAKRGFDRLNFPAIEENFNNLSTYLGCMAGNGYELPRQLLGKLGQVCCLFPYETNGVFNPKGMLVSTKTGKPTFIDLINKSAMFGNTEVKKTNLNMLIFGKTGSGKSNFMGYFIRYLWNTGGHIILLDKGNSFEKMVSFLRGKLYRYTNESPLSFNPFLLSKDEKGDFIYTKEELDFLVPLLISAIHDRFTKEEINTIKDILIDDILSKFYHLINTGKIKIVNFNSFYEFLISFREEVFTNKGNKQSFDSIKNQFPFEKVLIAFKKFYKGGIYETLFNAKENFDITNDQLTVFELDKIQEDVFLFRIVAICISKLVNTKFKSARLNGILKYFIVDEGTFILKDFMVEVTAGLFQTARKHNAGICFADQTFDKLHETGVANRIAGNTDTVIVLEQKFTEATTKYLKSYLGFTEASIRKVKAIDNSGKWREGVLKINDFVFNFRLKLSKEYYLALNTDSDTRMARINKKIMKYFEETGNMEYAIEQIKDEEHV
ncbi:VirB4 family type IV secretion system protein [Chondrinema litorale]|uniref:VirB4 family type IV secretion system protein n=1 Tax=Chondrinema litorale TaxID=2994555 RepID=UPI002542CA03|nr:DUF87 domain-containing protein [Chondrinema litorale]UZR98994.1 DUF87 domain-containing protein [Chondrinema litorale]